jgi:predicted metal-dependent phosphotriesterase family hydrolase
MTAGGMPYIQTVRSQIDPADLGHTQIHEHLIWDSPR